MATHATTHTNTDRVPSYRDRQLADLITDLRAEVRTVPRAKAALERVEKRLKWSLRLLESWDTTHAERAKMLLGLGKVAAANTEASLIFDDTTRHNLLRQMFIGGDDQADDRAAENAELEREVLV